MKKIVSFVKFGGKGSVVSFFVIQGQSAGKYFNNDYDFQCTNNDCFNFFIERYGKRVAVAFSLLCL